LARMGLGRARGVMGEVGAGLQLSRLKGPVWVRAGSPCWDWLGIFYLLIFCPADSLFSEDDQASGQTGKKSWQEAIKLVSVSLSRSPVIWPGLAREGNHLRAVRNAKFISSG